MATIETELQGFAKRNYVSALRVADMIDAYTYVQKGRFFLTVDGRMAVIWALPKVCGDVLSEEDRAGVADALASVVDKMPENSSGQFIRYSHRNVLGTLNAFSRRIVNNPFAKSMAESICDMQERGARFGFFSHPVDARKAEDQIRKAREFGDDGTKLPDVRQLPAAGSAAGGQALVHECYLVFCMETHVAEDRPFMANVMDRLRATFIAGAVADEVALLYERDERRFMEAIEDIEAALSANGFEVDRVDGNGLCGLLYDILNPRRTLIHGAPQFSGVEDIDEALERKKVGTLRKVGDHVSGTTLLTSGSGWAIDGVHHRVTSVKVMPEQTRAAMLMDALNAVEGEGWTTINFMVPNQAAYRRSIRIKSAALASQEDLSGVPILAPDKGKLKKRRDDVDLVTNQINPEERNYHKVVRASVHIVVRDNDLRRCEKRAKRLEAQLWNSGYMELVRGDAMIHHSLPLNFRKAATKLIKRDFPVLSTNLCDLFPLYSGYQGVEDGVIMVNNSMGEPVFIDLFTKLTTAAHGLCVGGTGTGKSFLINALAAQMTAMRKLKIFCIDKGNSFGSLAVAMGGQTVVLVPEERDGHKPICLNPLYIDDSTGYRQPSANEMEYMVGIVSAMLKAGTADEKGVTERVSKEERNCLMTHLQTIFNHRGEGEELVLSHLYEELQKNPDDLLAIGLSRRMKDYTKHGTYGQMFDGKLKVNWESNFIHLETQYMADSPAIDVVMLCLFAQIEMYTKYRLPRDHHKLVIIDEAWKALAKQYLASIVSGFYRELRKYLCSVLLISQTLGDFKALVQAEGPSASDGILANTRHFFFLGASNPDYKAAKELFDISPEEEAMWKACRSLMPHYSEFFYILRKTNNQPYAGKLRLYSDPMTIWTSSTDPGDVRRREDMVKKLVAEKNLSDYDARVESITALSKEFPYGSKFQY